MDWHEGLGVSHEQWWADLLADGWRAELPELVEGAELVHEGRNVRRHAVRRWVPDRSQPEPGGREDSPAEDDRESLARRLLGSSQSRV